MTITQKKSKILFLICFIFFTVGNVYTQNNHEEMLIESLDDSEGYDVSGGNCIPGNIVITIKSNIPELSFDSNVEDIEQPTFDSSKQEYVFCHTNESFYLNISTPGYISKEVYIDATKSKYGFKIISSLPKGKVLIKTIPKNAYIDFGMSGIAPQLTSEIPFELNVGKYMAEISKNGYNTVKQEIEVFSDGNVNEISILLKPKFSKIELNVSNEDNSRFIVLPIINIDSTYINLSDLYDITKIRSFNSPGKVDYYKIYEGGIVPLPEGSHDIILNAPGYKTYSQTLFTPGGTTSPLSVIMKSITGYLTVIDNRNANGATVFVNDVNIGTIPAFKLRTKVGEQRIKIHKDGYLAEKELYKVKINEDSITDLYISMVYYKEVNITTNPQSAEVFVNNERQGFTPTKVILKEGKNEISIRNSGYLTYNQTINIEKDQPSVSSDLSVLLRMNYPIRINAEAKARAVIKENGNEIADGFVPGEISIPYGKYKLELYEKNKLRFSGSLNHNGKQAIKVPIHSWGTFTTLVADYYYQKNATESKMGNITKNVFNLFAKGEFGRFNVFIPGLSTSLLNATVFKVTEEFLNKTVVLGETEIKFENQYVFSGSCLFLNGEFRTGGSVFKNLDFNLLGSYVWHPTLPDVIPFSHITGTEKFYGVEIGTRISHLNVNLKIGKEIFNGDYNYCLPKVSTETKNTYIAMPVAMNNIVISIGFTLGQKVAHSNNMLRLWKKPLIGSY